MQETDRGEHGRAAVISWDVNLGNVISIAVLVVAVYRFSVKQAESQALRDQKIDIVLFGSEGRPGIVGDVETLKDDSKYIFDHLHKLGFERRHQHDRRESGA